ncbi:unnamed protein product [Diamesa tonsa]
MMSSSSLPVLNRNFLMTSGQSAPSESQSEISSVESDFSDFRVIGAQLGILNAEDVYTERFKIDRTKLEEMIRTEYYYEAMNRAEYFFTNLMKENVHISWPCRLKVGAKTRKDPHVRIVGRKEEVVRAKDKIMAVLDSKGNRVIMKMDVSYTDHSFIIGRGGNNIKRIMDDTLTHIHFPDSNRSNPTEKSNQVSLCGSLEGVEMARSLVRLSTPLLISFELPVVVPGKHNPDTNTPFVKDTEKLFNVQVIFSTRPKLHSSMVLVKGSEKDYKNVIEGTKRLMECMFDKNDGQILVNMHIEISTQHHAIVLGKSSHNLREIMARTGTKIIFPDANDMNIKPIKRSQVTISGSINAVYHARQQLLGNLPIAVIFDYPENTIDAEQLNKLMLMHDVFITSRQKSRQSTMCIVIKGIEKFISNIYDARHQILKLNSLKIKADIPATYYGPNDQFKNNSIAQLMAGTANFSPITPINSLPYIAWPASPEVLNLRARMQREAQQAVKGHNTLSPLTASMLQQHNKMTNNNFQMPSNMALSSRSEHTANNSELHTSGYQSFTTDSSLMDKYNSMKNAAASTSSAADGSSNQTSPENSVNYGNQNIPFGPHVTFSILLDLSSIINCLVFYLQSSFNDSMLFNFDPRIVAGFRAMNISPQQGEARIPTPMWQGAGISRTSPTPLENSNNNSWYDTTRNDYGGMFNMTTSLLDSTPVRQRNQLSKYNDITTLLTGLGLEHHIQHFINGEIDMTVFPTLNERDLLNLGVKPLGARRRIMMAVHEMASRINMQMHHQQKQQTTATLPTPIPLRFSGSAAPGDERKSSNSQ